MARHGRDGERGPLGRIRSANSVSYHQRADSESHDKRQRLPEDGKNGPALSDDQHEHDRADDDDANRVRPLAKRQRALSEYGLETHGC